MNGGLHPTDDRAFGCLCHHYRFLCWEKFLLVLQGCLSLVFNVCALVLFSLNLVSRIGNLLLCTLNICANFRLATFRLRYSGSKWLLRMRLCLLTVKVRDNVVQV